MPSAVDVHAHLLPLALQPRTPLPRLELDGLDAGRIMIGDELFRRVRRPLWDVSARVAELDEAGIGVQVVSPVPVTLGVHSAEGAAYLRDQNDLLAELVSESGGRLLAFGGVLLEEPDVAAEELRRIAGLAGIVGVEIGTTPAGRELDDPALAPFLAAAEEADLPLFVHPTGQATAIRRRGAPYTFGLGMHTDTALAGAALVFGGVLERFPRLRVALAHGCGSLPWTYPRLRYLQEPAAAARLDELLALLWADTLVFDPAHLALLVRRFGVGHLLLGTDHPFYPSPLAELVGITGEAAAQGVLTAEEADRVGSVNPWAFLGRSPR